MILFNVIVGVASILAFAFAIWQYSESRSYRRAERERLAIQERRNDAAVRVAVTGAQSVDLIVQRTKEKDVTIPELQNLARVTRGLLLFLATELKDQNDVLRSWQLGRRLVRSNISREEPGESSDQESTGTTER